MSFIVLDVVREYSQKNQNNIKKKKKLNEDARMWARLAKWWGGQERCIRIVLVGPSSSGKTSILYTAMGRRFSCDRAWCGKNGFLLYPSVGFNVETISGGIQLWDVSALRGRVGLWAPYLQEGDCCSVFVLDAAAGQEDLEEARALLQQWRSICALRGVPVCVFANKQDLPGARSRQWVASFLAWVDPEFQSQARLLWLIALRLGVPREIRKKLLLELASVFNGNLSVYETFSPENRGASSHIRLGHAQECISKALREVAGRAGPG